MIYRYSKKKDRWVSVDVEPYHHENPEWELIEEFPTVISKLEVPYVEVWSNGAGQFIVEVQSPFDRFNVFLCNNVIEMYKVFHLIGPYITIAINDEMSRRNNG